MVTSDFPAVTLAEMLRRNRDCMTLKPGIPVSFVHLIYIDNTQKIKERRRWKKKGENVEKQRIQGNRSSGGGCVMQFAGERVMEIPGGAPA